MFMIFIVDVDTFHYHDSKAATAIARSFLTDKKAYLNSLDSHGHKDGIITAHELQSVFESPIFVPK